MLQARIGALVQSYFSVSSTLWDTIISTKNQFPSTPIACVINVSNGAGTSSQSTWNTLINRLRTAGVIVLGWVDTNFGNTAQATVQASMDAWKTHYPQVDGIFFQSMGTQSTHVSYYDALHNYAITTKGFNTTAGNAKAAVSTNFLAGATVDTICIWDASGLDPVDSTYSQFNTFENNTLAVSAFGVLHLNAQWVAQMAQYVGWVYTTSDSGTGSAPYDSLPSYFNDLIELLDDLGSGRLSGQTTDPFGIKKLYHTKTGGEEYFTNQTDLLADASSTGRIQNYEGENLRRLSDGSWESNGGDNNNDLRLEIWSPAYSNTTQRQNARWLNVECTIYAKVTDIVEARDPPYAWQLYMKGGHHTTARPCEGCAYKFRWWCAEASGVSFPGSGSANTGANSFDKELCHSNYVSNFNKTTGNFPGTQQNYGNNRWHGAKAVQYNIIENGEEHVKLELYSDHDCSDASGNLVIRNNWKLCATAIDSGQYSVDSLAECSDCGRAADEILTEPYSVTNSGSGNFNRNLSAYRTDGLTSRFKFFSAREIDPNRPVAAIPGSTPGGGGDGGGTGTATIDQFGVKKIYPTKANSYEWYITMSNPTIDTTKFNPGAELTQNGDGSWKAISSNVRMNVYQKNGYNPTLTATNANNHAQCHQNGWMQNSDDWRNVEMTAYFKLVHTPSPDDFEFYVRGGRHLEPQPSCEGSALRGHVGSDGTTLMAKEQWHVAFAPNEGRGNGTGSTIVGKWTGIKFMALNKTIDGVLVTNQQLWIDKDANNTWTKYDEKTDAGGWGNQGQQCNGAFDQLISWGGPICSFSWNSFTNVDLKWLSVREIDPAGIPIDVPPDAEPGHCSG
jgi:Spherulation-specific family 4